MVGKDQDARSLSLGARNHMDSFSLPGWAIKIEAIKLTVFRLGLHQRVPQPKFDLPRWTVHLCILYQVRAVRGVVWWSVDYSQLYACAFDALKAGALASSEWS